ncbi:MAG: sugar-binding transcriptional regulator [Solirubrobacteraceae bacterium]
MSVGSRRPSASPAATPNGPAASVLAAAVARRYYIEGASKSEIAQEFGLSRFKVARVLDQARSSGLVRIELHYEGEIDLDLSVRLASHLKLRRCLVVDAPEEDLLQLRTALGRVAAGLLSEIVGRNDVLGLAWSRTLKAMASSLVGLEHCAVVQLSGALSLPDVDEGSIELVREVARIAGGPAFCFYAPMIVPAADTAESLRAHSEVARAMGRFSDVTKAVLSIGAWHPGDSTVVDAITAAEFDADKRLGVCAELCGIQLDERGEPVTTTLSDRIIGIPAEQLRKVDEIIAVAYGTSKAAAVRAAVRGGFVTDLITHTSLAERLLELP